MNNTYTIVNVAVNRPLFKEFAYKVESLIGEECIGARVQVNFAHNNQVGVITKINPPINFDE